MIRTRVIKTVHKPDSWISSQCIKCAYFQHLWFLAKICHLTIIITQSCDWDYPMRTNLSTELKLSFTPSWLKHNNLFKPCPKKYSANVLFNTWANIQRYSRWPWNILICRYMQKHNDNTINTRGHSSLEKYTSHFIERVVCERWVGDRTELQHIKPPTLLATAAFLSRSPGLHNWGPGGPASAGSWSSFQHLLSSWSELPVAGVR